MSYYPVTLLCIFHVLVICTMYFSVFCPVLYLFSRYKLLTLLSQFIPLVCSVDVLCLVHIQHSYSTYVCLCILMYHCSLLTSFLSDFTYCLLFTYFISTCFITSSFRTRYSRIDKLDS